MIIFSAIHHPIMIVDNIQITLSHYIVHVLLSSYERSKFCPRGSHIICYVSVGGKLFSLIYKTYCFHEDPIPMSLLNKFPDFHCLETWKVFQFIVYCKNCEINKGCHEY